MVGSIGTRVCIDASRPKGIAVRLPEQIEGSIVDRKNNRVDMLRSVVTIGCKLDLWTVHDYSKRLLIQLPRANGRNNRCVKLCIADM
jgi:hypothetical protein